MNEVLCIVCPNGCRMNVEDEGGELRVTGNLCPKGTVFAEREVRNPVRTVTTTVRTMFPAMPALPVRTSAEIPRGRIMDLMRFLADITVRTPLASGDIVAENPLGLGCDVIASAGILEEAYDE